MSYEFYRVFCATPTELEPERSAFYDVIAEFNEAEAMNRGILFVAVSLVRMPDKRPYQAAVDQNIRDSSYYVQLLEENWGPPERNFERDYAWASNCAADPDSPLRAALLLFKKPLLPHRVDAAIQELKERTGAREFARTDEFKMILRTLLERWLETIAPAQGQHRSAQSC